MRFNSQFSNALTIDSLRSIVPSAFATEAHESRSGDARSRGRMVTTREVKGIDQDVRLNRALWQLAEKMAELKGVRAAA